MNQILFNQCKTLNKNIFLFCLIIKLRVQTLFLNLHDFLKLSIFNYLCQKNE